MSQEAALSQGERLKWFNRDRLGMFIHWGLPSLPLRGYRSMGEGIKEELIQTNKYHPLAEQFRPSKFDPDSWVALAKEAGMKYLVLTTRGHDGF